MATKQELRTFRQIVDQIMGLMKYQSTDTVSRTKVKEDIQRAYLQEIVPFHQWPWLRNKVNLQAQAYFGTGTASVTINSTTVILTETLVDSRAGYLFSINGSNEVYKIRFHTGGSTTLTLDMPYMGSTSSTASFKIWRDALAMPAEASEVLEITHPNLVQPLTGVGLQELRRIAAAAPKAEGRPFYYTLGDYVDPSPFSTIPTLPATATRASSGLVKTIKFASTLGASNATLLLQVGDRIQVSTAGANSYNIEAIVSSVTTTTNPNDTITYSGLTSSTEASTADTTITVLKSNTESYERQKELIIYPSIYNTKTSITVDYVKEVEPLVDDTDEPALPLADRIVLFWIGLSYSYSRERNSEESLGYRQLAEQRLARMAGNTNESTDKPSFNPSKLYLNSKRNSIRNRRSTGDMTGFGSGSTTNPLGTPNQVAIFGTDGTLQSSSTISSTELTSLNGIVGNIETRLNALGLASGSAGNRVLVSDAVPSIQESAVTSTELTYLTGAEPSTEVILADNTAVAANAATWVSATYDSLQIIYSLKRGSARESGTIVLAHDGSTVGIAQSAASVGVLGVTFTADISAGTLRLRYTTTSTGSAATLKYQAIRWLA